MLSQLLMTFWSVLHSQPKQLIRSGAITVCHNVRAYVHSTFLLILGFKGHYKIITSTLQENVSQL